VVFVWLAVTLAAPTRGVAADSGTAPDLSIASTGDWVGAGVINANGHNQAVTQQVPPGRERTLVVKVTNPSSVRRTFRVSGSPGTPDFSVQYRDQRGDVTQAVTGGTYTVLVGSRRPRYLYVAVRAAADATTGASSTLLVRGELVGHPELADVVRADLVVPPLRVWGVSYDGKLRCAASFPQRTLDPGFETGVSFTLTNLTEHRVRRVYSSGYLVFRDADGKKLLDTRPKFEGPEPATPPLKPHQQVRLYAFDTRIRWSGPLTVIPVCSGMRLRMPRIVLPVASPGAPATVADAIDLAVAVPGSPFQVCHPGSEGEPATGSFEPPDGRDLPPLTLRCWAEVREENGFDVVSLELVSPSDGPDYTINENGFVFGPPPLPGTGNFLAARWSFVVTTERVRPYIALAFARTVGEGTGYEYELHEGTWSVGGSGPCGYQSAALALYGTYFFLEWISACSQEGSGSPPPSRRVFTVAEPGRPPVTVTR